jgi:ankyrin repeat protein
MGSTPLYFAAVHGDRKLVEIMIAKGAKVNERYYRNSWPIGKTPLTAAKENGYLGLADFLRKHGGVE